MATTKKAASAKKCPKYVYTFGAGKAEGNKDMKNLLGGKGANLAEMCSIGLPVPGGFTVTTECCTAYFENKGKYPSCLAGQVKDAVAKMEKVMGKKFGDKKNPLLVSCRSGARQSMPGMMETVLNVGLCTETIPGLIAKTNERFVYDAYRRLITMYADVVMEKAEGIEPADGEGIRRQLEGIMDALKEKKGYKSDTDLTSEDLQYLCKEYKAKIKKVLGKEFPDTAEAQLWGGIGAVFKSWNGKRAIAYRRIEGIPDDWGTAVNVQAMVFGNMGETSATGVAFSRNPATGEHKFYGEWLINAQGEDVVAGIRTPNPLNKATKNEQNKHMKSLEEAMPAVYKQLDGIQKKLEKHYHDMQDIEFTIEDKQLWMLQCRVGKRTGMAALNMAIDMVKEKLIDEKEAVMRLKPAQLDELLHPILDPSDEKKATVIAKGLPAGPGGAVGKIYFTAEAACEAVKKNPKQPVVLVREETNPEDVEGMRVANGILTARGGMTSHAALVARGWGKCCIVGCADIDVNTAAKTMKVAGKTFKEGDVISLNGSKGYVYGTAVKTMDASENPALQKFMKLVDKYRKMKIRTNADNPADAAQALKFGAEGIGLFRTEHMFYGKNSEKPLFLLRQMILAKDVKEREAILAKLGVYVKASVKDTMKVMNGKPVVFRLLDPPLHEFVPQDEAKQKELAAALKIDVKEVRERGEGLHEVNPMMGHRGVRLGVTYPEVSKMQFKAIFEATAELHKEGFNPKPEIMVPVTCSVNELKFQKKLCDEVFEQVKKATGDKKLSYMFGTMIEIPRAALLADEMAEVAEFFSFGTNDMTQMGFGFSRDDIGAFMGDYLDKKILPADPFQTLDQDGIGQLVQIGTMLGRDTRPNLEVGICGEHGGDAESVKFCYFNGLDYVSCSPFRVPIARLAAAQAAIEEERAAKGKKCKCGKCK